MTMPRPEYPRPQFVRLNPAGEPDWLCLNGEWEFEIDAGDTGRERGLTDRPLSGRILVPFCPESTLSGVGNTDVLNAVWYRREVALPAAWPGKRVLLHFQAVDYDATVWVNGTEVGRHRGGFTPFTCDLTGIADGGETVTVVVRARDSVVGPQPRGKQSQRFGRYSVYYTRTTGMWQTVWMEATPKEAALRRPRITPDVAGGAFYLETPLTQNQPGYRVRATLRAGETEIAAGECAADIDLSPRLYLPIPPAQRRLWSPEDPFLYDLDITLLDSDGRAIDRARSYAGLRSVAIEGKRVKINGESVFQRLVLDQGYWPDGVMTAPTDDALRADVENSLAAGFNGARLHQKVFEERFLYHADRLGYLVWGEFADWGCAGYGPYEDHQQPGATYITQWLEAVERDYSHPSIIGWCPLNETYQTLGDRITGLDDVTRGMFLAAKAMDTTRPVLDTSGYAHRILETDVYDSHDYWHTEDFAEGLAAFAARHVGLAQDQPYINPHHAPHRKRQAMSTAYRGQPFFLSEWGAFLWRQSEAAGEKPDTLGVGRHAVSLEDFYHRFEAACNVLLDDPNMFGYCYCQLVDMYEQEENGMFTFDRRPKFDNDRLFRIQRRPAAIERG
jgi:beta-galactosidase/beta-glucuronidase